MEHFWATVSIKYKRRTGELVEQIGVGICLPGHFSIAPVLPMFAI